MNFIFGASAICVRILAWSCTEASFASMNRCRRVAYRAFGSDGAVAAAHCRLRRPAGRGTRGGCPLGSRPGLAGASRLGAPRRFRAPRASGASAPRPTLPLWSNAATAAAETGPAMRPWGALCRPSCGGGGFHHARSLSTSAGLIESWQVVGPAAARSLAPCRAPLGSGRGPAESGCRPAGRRLWGSPASSCDGRIASHGGPTLAVRTSTGSQCDA